MPAPGNLIHQTSTTNGTGAFTLTAVDGKREFTEEFATGGSDTFDYFISNQDADEWERGTGSIATGGVLVRDSILESSNSDAVVTFSAGNKDITNDLPAGDQVGTSLTQTLSNKTFSDDITVNGIIVGRSSGDLASNTAVGSAALDSCTTGSDNCAFGVNAATALTVATNCTAIGRDALSSCDTGINNTIVGALAGDAITGGFNNSGLGLNALGVLNTGTGCTAMGVGAGSTITSGSNLSCFGVDAEPSSATATNQVTLGDANVASTGLRCNTTTITALSDRRDKTDIVACPVGLKFINDLKPVKFTWALRQGSAKNGSFEAGFIAQDLQEASAKHSADWIGLVSSENPERLEATPGMLLPIAIKAIQELSARVVVLEEKLNATA